MKVLIVYAHPEPQSLNSALRDVAVHELEAQGHEVQVSDLYGMNWKSEVSHADFPLLDKQTRLQVSNASKAGFNANALTKDVQTEQEKLLWADTLILQFPLWWFTMPAILKGWVDRVYSCGFAHGIGDHSDKRWGDRYGEGKFEEARDAHRDHGWLGGALFAARDQWSNRRSSLSYQSWHPVLPGLHRTSVVCSL